MLWGRFGFFEKYMRQFGKLDLEYVYSSTRRNRPLYSGSSAARYRREKRYHPLPFFKQYFGGGSGSMRAGRFGASDAAHNRLHRTDRINSTTAPATYNLESNIEYRLYHRPDHSQLGDIAWALFIDMGNV